jgi:hypothetical protein
VIVVAFIVLGAIVGILMVGKRRKGEGEDESDEDEFGRKGPEIM